MKIIYLLPLLFLAVTPAFAYNSAFRPVYQPPGAGGSNPATLYCTLGEFLDSYNSTTNSFTCAAGGGGGENNTASSSGVGYSLVLPKVGVDLPFRGIFCAGDLLCSSNATDVRIEYTPTVSSIALNDLTDVIISGATYPSVLFYNGVEWVNRIFSINSITCGAGQFVNIINNQTGQTACDTPASSGITKVNSAPQTTAVIISDNSTVANSVTLKTLTQGTGITLTNGSNAVTVETNFKIDTDAATTATFLTGFDNSTGDFTRKLFQIATTTCGGTDKVSGINNQTGVVTCSTDSTGSGAISLGSNVSASNTSAYSNLWQISLTANSGNTVSGVIVAQTNTAGVAVQAGANLTSVAAAQGWCLWETPTAATANTVDFVVLSTTTTDTGETLWLPAVNTPQPILFTCTISTGASAPSLWINIQPEAAGTVTAKAGSYYIKTP